MLIHKATMGVLEYIWHGEYRTVQSKPGNPVRVPVMNRVTPADIPDYDPKEWWQVQDGSPLARKIHRNYPYLTPIVGENGELLDVTIARETGLQETDLKEEMRREARARGYKSRVALRPKNMFTFLKDGGKENELLQ